MYKNRWILLLLMMLIVTAVSCAEELPPLEGEITDLADEFINTMVEGNFDHAVDQYFDSTMKRALPANKLAESWETILAQSGPFKGMTGKRTEEIEGYDAVIVTTQFQHVFLDIRVVFNKDRRISGLWFLPAEGTDDSAYQSPSYVVPEAFSETEVVIGAEPWELPGTLSIPSGSAPFPAVVLVHGSGPQDRDESLGPNKPFKDIAQGLASQGIAVLRYEKRSKEHAEKLIAEIDSITLREETVEDALAAVSFLKGNENIDPNRVYVLGHSLGGTAAPRIGAENPDIAGLIILAGAARPLEDLILDQVTYLVNMNGEPSPEETEELNKIQEQVARVKDPDLSTDTPPSDLPLEIPAAYWLDLKDYSPVETAGGLSIPILILQGERDYQVTMEDFEFWRNSLASRQSVKLKSYPNLNHLFMEGEGKSQPEEYFQPGNVSKMVVDDIAGWIKQ